MDSKELLLSVLNNLVIILGIVIALGLIVLIIVFFISMLIPSNENGLDTPDERFEFRVRLTDLEQEVEKLKKRSDQK